MNWLLIAVVAAILCGTTAGAILVVRNPAFWAGLITEMMKAAIPFIGKRNTPEIEAMMQECYRRGGEWDNFNKRCRQK